MNTNKPKQELTINGVAVIKINNRNKAEFLLMHKIKPIAVKISEANNYTLEFYFEKGERTREIVQAFNSVKAGKSYEFNYRAYLEAQYEIARLISQAKKEARANKPNNSKPARSGANGRFGKH